MGEDDVSGAGEQPEQPADDSAADDPAADATEADSPDPTRAGLVISAAIGIVGVTFGVLARTAGLDVPRACVMSLLVFTGASQFAVVGVVVSGGSAVAGFGAAT